MAKDNLFLGFGRGKLGDLVMYRQNGTQITRARNRSPKNPQTALQLLQRVLMKTSSVAYSLMQDITNHSFQGRSEGTECQSRFTALNIAEMRRRLADVINSGDPEEIYTSSESNFAAKSASLAEMNPYIVSEGSLPTMDVQWETFFKLVFQSPVGGVTWETITYQQVVEALGLTRGDQLTFLMLSCDDRDTDDADLGHFNSFRYARVILEPNDGDMTSPFFISNGVINKPNVRNEGAISFGFIDQATGVTQGLQFFFEGISIAAGALNSAAAATVIASRLSGNIWQRSSQSLVVRPSALDITGHLSFDHGVDLLGAAVASYMTVQNSSLYLNQSENF